MRPVHNSSHILPFTPHNKVVRETARRPEIGPLRRIELHQIDHDEVRSLRARLLELILDNEQARKTSRLRLVN